MGKYVSAKVVHLNLKLQCRLPFWNEGIATTITSDLGKMYFLVEFKFIESQSHSLAIQIGCGNPIHIGVNPDLL